MNDRLPMVRIELRPSSIDRGGVGLFAVRDIAKYQKLADGLTEQDFQDLVSWKLFNRCNEEVQRKIMAFCVGTPFGFIPPPELDFDKLSIEWYFNHSCDGNCGFNDDGDFVAIRDIRKGEELTYDYGLIESNPEFSMKCRCGSDFCRRVITGNDWREETFQRKNLNQMHPHLRKLISVPVL